MVTTNDDICNQENHAIRAALEARFIRPKKAVVNRSKVSFNRPSTKKQERMPNYSRVTKLYRCTYKHSLIKYPLVSEIAMKKIEKHNTLTFIVDNKADKKQVKNAINDLYDVKVCKVNLLIRPDGKKKAYIKLKPDWSALRVANKIGLL